MKPNLLLVTVFFILLTTAGFGQFNIDPSWLATTTDIDGVEHDVAQYIDDGKSVFIYAFSPSAGSYQNFLNHDFTDLYNTYGQAGSQDIVVLCYAFGVDLSGLSNLDYSAQLGASYSNVSYVDGNPAPMILMDVNDTIPFVEGDELYLFCADGYQWNPGATDTEAKMDFLRTNCCTALENFDPGLTGLYPNNDCNYGSAYTVNNGSPEFLNNINIAAYINGQWMENFNLEVNLDGCTQTDFFYENDLVGGDDTLRLEITDVNDAPENDTVETILSSFTNVSGHLRLEYQNPSGSGFATLWGQGIISPENVWLESSQSINVYFAAGCYQIFVSTNPDNFTESVELYEVHPDLTLRGYPSQRVSVYRTIPISKFYGSK